MGIDSPVHLVFIGVVALLVLGPRKLPEVARTLGNGLREFREAMNPNSEPPIVVSPPAHAAAAPPAPSPAAVAEPVTELPAASAVAAPPVAPAQAPPTAAKEAAPGVVQAARSAPLQSLADALREASSARAGN